MPVETPSVVPGSVASAGPGLGRVDPARRSPGSARVGAGASGPLLQRGRWLPTLAPRAGLGALFLAMVAVAGRPWSVPLNLVVVSLVVVIGTVRQVAARRETRRLRGQIEEIRRAAEERRQLLTRLLERSVSDRRRVAEQLHRQALAAHVSFAVLFGAGRSEALVAQASEHVREALARHARSLHDLVLSIRPMRGGNPPEPPLVTPVRLSLDTTVRAAFHAMYGDQAPPRLDLVVAADELVLDWTVETVMLQIVQEALHNVWRHSDATEVQISVELDGAVPVVGITDNGVGFESATMQQGAGIPAMRAAATVVEGRVSIRSSPGEGTSVVASLGADHSESRPRVEHPPAGPGPHLRLVPDPPDDTA